MTACEMYPQVSVNNSKLIEENNLIFAAQTYINPLTSLEIIPVPIILPNKSNTDEIWAVISKRHKYVSQGPLKM